jgi:hypothetical protein
MSMTTKFTDSECAVSFWSPQLEAASTRTARTSETRAFQVFTRPQAHSHTPSQSVRQVHIFTRLK